jgi:MFS family permease
MISVKPRYRFVYLATFLLSLHYALTVYINSSFLANHFSQTTIEHLYMVGSLLTIFCLIWSSRVINWFGNFKLVLLGIALEISALSTLAFSSNRTALMLAFIAFQALPPLLAFGLDIFFEGALVTMRDAEKVRSYYLTFGNVAFVIAPLAVGALVAQGAFSTVYSISAICIAILWFLIFDLFSKLKPRRFREVGFVDSVRKFLKRKSLPAIMAMNFLLQSFYAVMVIFNVPHLHNTIGISWAAIGVILTFQLLPFVIFEAPLGKLFSRYHDERQFLLAGFFIMAAATITMAHMHTQSIFAWAGILFISRIGASFVEVSSEAAFFKRVTDQDAGFIGVFRLAGPTSYVIAPLILSFFIPALSITTLYTVLGCVLLFGTVVAYKARL